MSGYRGLDRIKPKFGLLETLGVASTEWITIQGAITKVEQGSVNGDSERKGHEKRTTGDSPSLQDAH